MSYNRKKGRIKKMEERTNEIIEKLKREGPLRWKDLYQQLVVEEGCMSKATLNRRLSDLSEPGGQIVKKKLGTSVYYFLNRPEDWSKFEEIKKEYLAVSNENIIEKYMEKSQEARKLYWDNIKEKVVEPWMEQLPEIEYNGIYHPKRKYIRERKPFKGEDAVLPVEKEILFEDFKKHVNPSYGDPFEELNEFKKSAEEFWKLKDDIEKKIDKVFKNKIKEGKIHENFVRRVYESSCDLAKGDDKAFNANMDPLHKSFNVTKYGGEYHFNYGVDPFVIKEISEGETEKDFEKKMRGCVGDIVKEIKKDKYVNKVKDIVFKVENLKQLRKEMKSSLERHYYLSVSPREL